MIPFFSSWASVYPNSFVPELTYAMKLSETTIKKSIITIAINLIGIMVVVLIAPMLMLFFQLLFFYCGLIKKIKNSYLYTRIAS